MLISFPDENGRVCTYTLQNVLHFPGSPVNIISPACLASMFNDTDGTSIQSRWKQSTLVWDHGRHRKILEHNESNLPEIVVNNGDKTYNMFCNVSGNEEYRYPTYLTIIPRSIFSTRSNILENASDFTIGQTVTYITGEISSIATIRSIKEVN